MNRSALSQFGLAVAIGGLVGLLIFRAWSSSPFAEAGAAHVELPAPVSELPVIEDFTLPAPSGQSVNFAAFRAGRPFAIAFGQIQCPACAAQLESFKQVYEKYGDSVAILEVHLAERPEQVAAYVKRKQSPFTTVIDSEAMVFRRYAGSDGAIPVTVIGDGEGRIYEVGGYVSPARLSALFDHAFAQREGAGA